MWHHFIALILLVVCSSLQANSLWQVTKEGRSFYLAGTIHLLSPADYPLPAAYSDALHQSSLLMLETPLDELESAEGLQRLIQNNRYPDGENLLKHLSPALAQQLSQYCTTHQLPLEQISRFKPAFAALMLTSHQLQQQGVTAPGLDRFLLDEANKSKLPNQGFETLEQHIAILDQLNQQGADVLIQSTLDDLANSSDDFSAMKQAWRDGNTLQLESLFLKDLQQYPALYQILIVKRNQAWLQQLPALMQQHKLFIAVGALHLVGPDGLLPQLHQQGYQIRQIRP